MEKEKQFIKREIPTGTGRESEPKETLPAVEVANEVIWVNPDFPELPFDIKEGESTKLGMFLTPRPREGEKTFDLKVLEGHGRSGLLGRAIFKDKQGRFYRDVDLKGMGLIVGMEVRKIEPRDKETSYGIFNLDYAIYAKDKSEEFLASGIRTERYLALIKLNEIVDEKGERISIEEARKRGMLNPNQEPVIALRALGTKFRVEDILPVRGDFDYRQNLLKDARKLVAQELGVKNLSAQRYLKWFAKTAGENLGLIHKNGWCHRYLNPHNITLDCRIVDLDSVESFDPTEEGVGAEKMEREYKQLLGTLGSFYSDFLLPRASRRSFSKAYQKAFKA